LGNVLNTRAKQATAAGLAVAALGGGIWAANRGDNDPSVHAATPVATSTPNTPSATETATTQPAPSTSEATPTTEAPTPTVGETTPSTELGTLPPISLSLLKSQIDPQKNQELLDTYFDLSDRANLVAHFKYSIGDEVTDQGIALKQKQLQKLLRNKGVQDILGGKGILTAESAKKAADNGTLGNEIVMYSENASNQAINIAEAKLGISLADAVDGALMSTELEQGLIGNFQPLYDRNERPTYYTLPEKSYIFDAEQYNVIPYHDKSAMFVGVVTIMSADKQGKHDVWYTENYLMPIGNGQFVGMRYYAHKLTQ
jgi:hypothetical protein